MSDPSFWGINRTLVLCPNGCEVERDKERNKICGGDHYLEGEQVVNNYFISIISKSLFWLEAITKSTPNRVHH